MVQLIFLHWSIYLHLNKPYLNLDAYSKIMPFDLESVLRFSCLKTFFVGGKEKCLMCELGKLKGLEVDFTDLEDVEADGKIGNLT